MPPLATGAGIQAAQIRFTDNFQHANGPFPGPWVANGTEYPNVVSGQGVWTRAGSAEGGAIKILPSTAMWAVGTIQPSPSNVNSPSFYFMLGSLNSSNAIWIEYQVNASNLLIAWAGYIKNGVPTTVQTLSGGSSALPKRIGIGYHPALGNQFIAYYPPSGGGALVSVSTGSFTPSTAITQPAFATSLQGGSSGSKVTMSDLHVTAWNGLASSVPS